MVDVSASIQTLLVLGASGDMVSRLLLPAVGQLLEQQPDRRLLVVGTGMEELTHEAWLDRIRASFATVGASGPGVDDVLARTTYHRADVTDVEQLRELLERCEGTPAIYFALPPAVTDRVCTALAEVQLPEGLQLALEKPFGFDHESAVALNAQLASLVSEQQIHRVDHFLGRSTVLNLLGLRFANRIFEPLWNRDHVAGVDIVYDEVLGLEGRAGYYDHAGALVDMIQSHLLQVMAIVAMEPPATLAEADVRGAKAAVLRATRVAGGSPERSSRRARYTAGEVEGRTLPAYVDEAGVDPANETETLAEVTFEIDSWRWAGVPFTLRSGKAMAAGRPEPHGARRHLRPGQVVGLWRGARGHPRPRPCARGPRRHRRAVLAGRRAGAAGLARGSRADRGLPGGHLGSGRMAPSVAARVLGLGRDQRPRDRPHRP